LSSSLTSGARRQATRVARAAPSAAVLNSCKVANWSAYRISRYTIDDIARAPRRCGMMFRDYAALQQACPPAQ
jgi:hypothetical protein